MIDHVSIAVADLPRSAAFYDAVLAPLGLTRMAESDVRVGFGKTYPEFWINLRQGLAPVAADSGCHVCLRAADRQAVIRFHAAALRFGGADDGAPGERQATVTACFGAFIRDCDGNRIEAVTFPRKPR